MVGRLLPTLALFLAFIAGLLHGVAATAGDTYTYDFIVNVVNGDLGPHIYYVKLDGVLPSVDQFTVHVAPDRATCSIPSGGSCADGVTGFIDGDEELTISGWEKASSLAGTLLFSIITTARVSQIEIKYHRPLYEPGWLIKENGVEVYRESANGGNDREPSPVTYTYYNLRVVPIPFTTKSELKNAVNACLSAVPSGEACCSTDSNCADPSSARCGSAGCVDMPDWDVSLVTDMEGLFRDCPTGEDWCGNVVVSTSAFNQPIGSWNTARVTSMRTMFMDAAAFNQPIGSWNTSQVTDMARMFQGADAFNQPIGAWYTCLLYTSPSPRDLSTSRMPSSA